MSKKLSATEEDEAKALQAAIDSIYTAIGLVRATGSLYGDRAIVHLAKALGLIKGVKKQ